MFLARFSLERGFIKVQGILFAHVRNLKTRDSLPPYKANDRKECICICTCMYGLSGLCMYNILIC
jgi:hypothetical protein